LKAPANVKLKPSLDAAKIKQMKADGLGASAIAKALKVGRASVYRALGYD
jgi:DNA invertase Pin-like site-specific DNA recombinase